MNPEQLHDALNLLDEDLIAETDRLRRRRFSWQHLGALAACLAVVCVVGAFAFSQRPGSAESAPENGNPELVLDESSLEQGDTKPGNKDSDDLSNVWEVADGDKNVILMESMLVEVTAVGENSLTATVLQSDRFHAAGDSVTIRLTELTRLIEGKNAYPLPEDGQVFFEGAVLVVDYSFDQNRKVVAECITFGE